MAIDTIAAIAFAILFLFRYTRTIVSVYSYNTYKPKPVLKNPTYTSKDVSVIIPTTFREPDKLIHCIQGILLCKPAKVYVVTAKGNIAHLETLFKHHSFDSNIVALGVDKLNKRTQILKAIPFVDTAISVLADDDVFWPDNYLPYLLAVFEDPAVGAGGTRQRVRRDASPTFWNFLGIAYLERRVWNNCATNAMDGSISTLSGRTAAYRTEILNTEEFEYYFTHDSWRGKPLNSDDDKCLTRYVYSHGWKITLQFDPHSVIETTVEGDHKYLDQCMRWARAHWRGNFTVMENETYWCSRQYFWGLYYIYVGQFQTPALVWDSTLFFLLWLAVRNAASKNVFAAMACLVYWVLLTKIIKLIPHLMRYPQDVKFLPVSILFSYYHGFLNVKALFTMQQTHWGSQNLEQLQQTRKQECSSTPSLLSSVESADSRIDTPVRSRSSSRLA